MTRSTSLLNSNMKLDHDNLELYAAKYYSNPVCLTTDEFKEDLKRVQFIKRLLKRYIRGESIPIRLLLNHIISFYNVFDSAAPMNILKYKLGECEECLAPLKTCLIYLNLLRDGDFADVYPDIRMRDLIRKEVERWA